MSVTWRAGPEPVPGRPGAWGWPLVVVRGAALALCLAVSLAAFLPARLVERVASGARPVVTARITQMFCRVALAILGIGLVVKGRPMTKPGASVANHASWLDIVALNAAHRVSFVSKSEVARWPGIGFLARITGTLFISRDSRAAQAQRDGLTARLQAGDRLLFFPEGTSTDGLQVISFKSTLFAAFLTPELKGFLHVQPVSVAYHAPAGADPRCYAWWGDMAFGAHFLAVLARRPQGHVQITFHPALPVADVTDRKAFAARCEAMVRSAALSLPV